MRNLSMVFMAIGASVLAIPSVSRADADIFAQAEATLVLRTGAGEGPAWHPREGLYFSGGNRISRLGMDGSVQVVRDPSGSNGLLFDRRGRLLVCEPGQRRVTRTELDGSVTVLTADFQGKPYNQPNDITLDSQGRIYFSDPRYGSREDMQLLDEQGRAIEGVYRIDLNGDVTRIITHEVDRPNGLIVSDDDQYLFVADNNNNAVGGARKLWRFRLMSDGSVDLASQTLLYDWKTGRGPDGMALDEQGRLFVAGGLNRPNPPFETADEFKGGVYVFNTAGERLAFIGVRNDEVTNCAFGGADLKTLYITAGGTLWTVRVNAPGRTVFHETR
jgi:gluconolactonase